MNGAVEIPVTKMYTPDGKVRWVNECDVAKMKDLKKWSTEPPVMQAPATEVAAGTKKK